MRTRSGSKAPEPILKYRLPGRMTGAEQIPASPFWPLGKSQGRDASLTRFWLVRFSELAKFVFVVDASQNPTYLF
jgi:hypothetical protein